MIGEENDLNEPSLPSHQDTLCPDAEAVSSSSSSFLSTSSENELNEARNENNQSNENTSRELVIYNPSANGGGVTEPVPEPSEYRRLSLVRHYTSNCTPKVLPSVGAFTVQCANCFKWRLIPTKEKYEEIREHILELPFFCETAREWRPDICCDDPADITQDGSRLWAIDKPNIAQPPPGWERLLNIRGEGSTKFADVYYVAPSGKKLRSTVDIQKYLIEHPEYQTDDVSMARFSFQIPKPLQENYVRKRRAQTNASCDDTRPLEPGEVHPLSWATPGNSTALQLGRLGLPDLPSRAPVIDPVLRPAKKKVKKTPAKQMHRSTPLMLAEPPVVNLENSD